MSESEVREFLTGSPPHTGKLATTRHDGRPHVAPIWFVLDDDGSILFTTSRHTLKARTIQRDPRVAICVDDERPPFAFVTVEGIAEIVDDADALLRWATVIGGRYMGADQAEAYGRRNSVPEELLVRIHPHHIVAAADIAL